MHRHIERRAILEPTLGEPVETELYSLGDRLDHMVLHTSIGAGHANAERSAVRARQYW